MSNTKLDIRQVETKVLQDQIDSQVVTGMDSALASINSELIVPGRMIAQTTPSLVVSVGSGTISNPNTAKKRVLPFISGTPLTFAGGTITFPPTSGSIVVAPGSGGSITIGSNQFVAVTVQLDATSQMVLSIGAAAGSLPAVVIPGGALTNLTLGYIIVQSNGAGQIQNITNTMIYQTDMPAVSVGATFDPNTILTGVSQLPIQTDWVNFTPTGAWVANTTYLGKWRRLGDTMQVRVKVNLSGAPDATTLVVNLPSGFVIDTTKLANGTGNQFEDIFGMANLRDAGVTVWSGHVVSNGTAADVRVLGSIAIADARLNNVTNTSPATWGTADNMNIEFSIPIVGWTANQDFGSVLVNNDGNVLIA